MSIDVPVLPSVKKLFDENGRLIVSPKELHGPDYTEGQAFFMRSPTAGNVLPFIVSFPHAGIVTGEGFLEKLHASTTLQDILARTDIYTDFLVDPSEFGAWKIGSAVAPSVLNVGRPINSIHPMHVRGNVEKLECNYRDNWAQLRQGLVALNTAIEAKQIYKGECIPSEEDILSLITTYYDPFHQALRARVDQNLEGFGYNLLLDMHSFPYIEQDVWEDKENDRYHRPDIIIGSQDGKSCDPELVEVIERVASQHDQSLMCNFRFKGGFLTQLYARQACGEYKGFNIGDPRSEALQIEINKCSMGVNPRTGEIVDFDAFIKMQRFIHEVMGQAREYVCRKISYAPA